MFSSSSLKLMSSTEASASMDSWDKLIRFIELTANHFLGTSGKQGYKLKLACEEILSNIIRETNSGKNKHQCAAIKLNCYLLSTEDNDWLMLEIQDNGPHFDPDIEAQREIQRDQPLHERKEGGLGLFLVQQSVDHLQYLFLHNWNTYRLWMRIS